MEKSVETQYKDQIEKAMRCRAWFDLETSVEFLAPLREKLAKLKDVSLEDFANMSNDTFRAHVEANLIAAKEISDYFAIIEQIMNEGDYARKALEGNNIEHY